MSCGGGGGGGCSRFAGAAGVGVANGFVPLQQRQSDTQGRGRRERREGRRRSEGRHV